MEKDVFENGMKMEKKGLTKFSMIANCPFMGWDQ